MIESICEIVADNNDSFNKVVKEIKPFTII